jgi:hypothetical protein
MGINFTLLELGAILSSKVNETLFDKSHVRVQKKFGEI